MRAMDAVSETVADVSSASPRTLETSAIVSLTASITLINTQFTSPTFRLLYSFAARSKPQSVGRYQCEQTTVNKLRVEFACRSGARVFFVTSCACLGTFAELPSLPEELLLFRDVWNGLVNGKLVGDFRAIRVAQ